MLRWNRYRDGEKTFPTMGRIQFRHIKKVERFSSVNTFPPNLEVGGAMIKSPKVFYCPFGFLHLGSLGIYFDKMDPNFQKKNDQKCPVGGADDYWTGFC